MSSPEGGCDFFSGYVFWDPQGTRHALNKILSVDSGTQYECSLLGIIDQLSGGDAWLAAQATTSNGPVTVQDADGTTYDLGTGVVEDRNGNLIQYTFNGNGGFTVTDTAGRADCRVCPPSPTIWT